MNDVRDVRDVRTLTCPSCGAAITRRGMSWTRVVACEHCAAVLDATDPGLRILQRFEQVAHITPAIPLGTRGQWRGAPYEVIGFQVMTITVEQVRYAWREYLLFNPYHGFRYLTEYDGHWNDVVPVRGLPASVAGGGERMMRLDGRPFKHFQTATATTSYVLGEFPWEVRAGDQATVSDWVDPPRLLSSEVTRHEVNWSLGEYVDGREIWRAFKLPGAPPARRGVYANQPSPHAGAGTMWGVFAILAASLLLLMLVHLTTAGTRTVFEQRYQFQRWDSTQSVYVSPSFDLAGARGNVEVSVETDIENSWMALSYALINEATGAVHDFGGEVSRYSGYDEDGMWTEGSRRDRTRIGAVPGGRYFLRVESELPAGASRVQGTVRVRRNVPSWAPFLVALLALLLPPVWVSLRAASFEVTRWAESDHPKVTVETDGDAEDEE